MLHSFSFGELSLIFGIIIILFGGSRLASIGKSLGEGIANFKKGLNAAPPEEEVKQNSIEKNQVQVLHHVQINSNQDSDKLS